MLAFCDMCHNACIPTRNAYGDLICEDCWYDYLCTDKGKVEYLISICRGECPVTDYDADFLGLVVVCWEKYRYELNMTMKEIAHLEAKARKLDLI